MKAVTIIGLSCLVAAGYGTGLAQEAKPKAPATKTTVVRAREMNQKARIKQGVKSGELTRGETRRLATQQVRVRRDVAMAKSDGKVTPREQAKLQRDLNRSSRTVSRLKHNTRKQK
jgi:predicted NACHT family NTPase